MPFLRSLLLTSLLGLAVVALPWAGNSASADDVLSADVQVSEWLRLATAQDDQRLLRQLQAFSDDGERSLEQREATLFGFVNALRGLPPRSVGNEVMAFLGSYTPRFVMPHEDHATGEVPVYNIRSAVAGLEHAWQRQEAAYAGSLLLLQDPARLVQAFLLHRELPVRLGLLDALGNAGAGQLETVGFMALSGLEAEPDLALLAGEAALLTGDTRAFEQLLRNGSGATMTQVLRRSRGVFGEAQLARVLTAAIHEARPAIAAIAIAELTPALLGNTEVEDRLLGLLADRELGSAAALALAGAPGDRVQRELQHRADKGATAIEAGRAQMALDLISNRPVPAGGAD